MRTHLRSEPMRPAAVVASALVVLSLLSVVPLAAPASPASAPTFGPSTGATPVDGCTTITEPGVYRLTADVESAPAGCVEIRADGVVFDGGGHLLAGRGVDGGAAVVVGPDGGRSDATVRDVRLRRWAYGVLAEDDAGVTLDGVRARYTVTAASFVRASDVAVRDVRVGNVYSGLSVVNSTDVTVAGYGGRWARFTPLFVAGSTAVTVRDASVSRAGAGVVVFDSADVSMRRLSATETSRSGVSIAESEDVRIAGAVLGEADGRYTVERTPTGVATREAAELSVARSTRVRAEFAVPGDAEWAVDLGGNVSDVRATVDTGWARPLTVGGRGVRIASPSSLPPCPPDLDPLHRPVLVSGRSGDAALTLSVGSGGDGLVSAWAAPEDAWRRLNWSVDTDRGSASVAHRVRRTESRYVLSAGGRRGDGGCAAEP